MTEIKLYQNFESALNKLKQYISTPVTEERDVSGIIQAFEYTFELSWKTLQKALISEGFEPRGPKHCIELGIKHGHIKFASEDVWKSILSDRNLTVHTYKEQTANLVLENIVKKYVTEFEALLHFLKENY